MIFVGIDDTDILGARGTNQLAKEIVRRAAPDWTCRWIVRHQLLHDSRIPFTSKNGSASMVFEPIHHATAAGLTALCRQTMQDWFISGSDPGLCVSEQVAPEIIEFGRLCQQEIVTQELAGDIARRNGVFLEGLGGTNGGIIGALAAIGLARTGNDGRVVQWQGQPDDLAGLQPVAEIARRGVTVREQGALGDLSEGLVDIGKHLRPNLRGDRAVLFVDRASSSDSTHYFALKLT